MLYAEELFSVSFEDNEDIRSNPVPYGRMCLTSTEKTRYVGIAYIRRNEPQFYSLEHVNVVILPGRDRVTGQRRERILVYARSLAGKRYVQLTRSTIRIHIAVDVPLTMRDVAVWMPSKCMIYHVDEITEDVRGA